MAEDWQKIAWCLIDTVSEVEQYNHVCTKADILGADFVEQLSRFWCRYVSQF